MDLFHTIKAAQKFIYITGWSVYTKINLVRGEDDPGKFSAPCSDAAVNHPSPTGLSGRVFDP
jgi:hypothetical protein